ncbi:MAG: NAD(P)H-dependent oxidoreductase subunit E [Thermoguttaceae bacterium]
MSDVGSGRLLDANVRKAIQDCLPRYPTKQAATLPALHLVNDRLGYVPPRAVVELAELLELSPAQVQDMLSFYGFFKQDKPQGHYRVWICRSVVCGACNGEEILNYVSKKLGIKPGETTPDGRVTLEFSECLGVCDAAPVVMVNETLYGGVTKEKIDELVGEMMG